MELAVDDLAVSRGGVPLLAGVSFHVPAGGALVLRGPNGCGKTTLLRALCGLQPADAGRVSVTPDMIAYAAHADGTKDTLSVTENLRFWAALHGGRDIAPALEALNLRGLEGRRAGTLSAGQKRRLGLARLLVTGRPIWALDEPTVSLDVASVALFGQVVRAHLDAGGLAVIATHIDLGLPGAAELDLSGYRAALPALDDGGFDEAFG